MHRFSFFFTPASEKHVEEHGAGVESTVLGSIGAGVDGTRFQQKYGYPKFPLEAGGMWGNKGKILGRMGSGSLGVGCRESQKAEKKFRTASRARR